jgi:4-phytase/acid phosphatase
MKLFGAYDRAYLAQAGLLSPKGCAEAGRVYIWADTDQRTLETGRALAEGMLPDCAVEVHALPEGTDDPLFSPIKAGVGRPDRALAAAAVSGRIGGKPEALLDAYRPALETMQQVLLGCKPGTKCPPEGKTVKQSLLELPASVGPGKSDRLAELRGPLTPASTLAQVFLLEYANGMAGKELGWGRVNESNLRQMMTLHTAYSDLLRRTPQIGRAQASNLLSHMLKAMEQAVAGKAVPGALGKPGDRVVILVGHDTNLCNVAGMLGLSWLIEGYQRDDTPPGGALVFELWRRRADGEHAVRTYYMAQTLEQMRRALPLTLDSPPPRAPVFMPRCSTAGEVFACGWKAFQRAIDSAIDPAFVKP